MDRVRILLKGSGRTIVFNSVSSVRMQEGMIIIKHGSLTNTFNIEDVDTMLVEEG